MSKPFDATTKDLLEADPEAWLAYLGQPTTDPIEIVDSDLSTISAESDKVFRVAGLIPYFVHAELQSSLDLTLPRRLLRYNVLLDYRHGARVWSVAVLLRPEADHPGLTGTLDLRLPDGRPLHNFRYGVVRAWQQPVESLLRGRLGTLPMALLADLPSGSERSVVQRIDERLLNEAPVAEAARLMTSTFLLAGLRFEREAMADLFLGVRTMNLLDSKILKDSSSYQLLMKMMRKDLEPEIRKDLESAIREDLEPAIRNVEARSILLDLATDRFGPPTTIQRASLEAIEDHDRLSRLCRKVVKLSSWDELLVAETHP